MPLQATSGAASYDGFGGGVAVVPTYIEDVFSTWLYTGNGSTQTITNGIDLAGKGGLVWIKERSTTDSHRLVDTVRGLGKSLRSNEAIAQVSSEVNGVTSFNVTGFDVGTDTSYNASAVTYASWTFRKQPKFFDVVTYTGNGSATNSIAHNLKSMPGFIVVKRTNSTSDWHVVARYSDTNYIGGGSTNSFSLNTTAIANNGVSPTDRGITTTAFDAAKMYGGVGSFDVSKTNVNGGTYVAYIFAHDAGGFGLTGTDNVISCGSFTTDGSANATVDLGYEPQLVIAKRTSNTGAWCIQDNMRGFTAKPTTYSANPILFANGSDAEIKTGANTLQATATGFTTDNISYNASSTYIYIAIRRGPMKVPTTGTSVFGISARTGTGANATVTGSAGVSDAVLIKNRGVVVESLLSSRLTGTGYLSTSATAAEIAAGTSILQANPWDVMDGVKVGSISSISNASGNTFINYLFDRAPSFFDEVCYTGTGSARTVSHNLAAVPELLFVKARSNAQNWSALCTLNSGLQGRLNTTDSLSAPSAAVWGSGGVYVAPTSSVFTVGTDNETNASGWTYVAYLFATCPGVSKVGSYTGTATTKQIDCGFTAGARFVLIKRTDSTGGWYVWDTARGIVSGNDPYLLLNSTAAEVTSTDYVDTYSAGFEISSTAPAAINASGGSFIFLAIS